MHFFILLPPLAYKTISPAPPVGLAYLAAIIIDNGLQVTALTPDAVGKDIVIRGEGEQTIVYLIGYLEGKTNIEAIDGVSYLGNGKIIHNKDRSLIKNLDEIPFPAWEFFSIGHFESVFRSLSSFSLPIVSSRGCPGKCTFCYKGIFGNRFRVRSAENIIREIFTCKMLLISKSFLL